MIVTVFRSSSVGRRGGGRSGGLGRGGRGRLRHRNSRTNDGEQCHSRPNDLGAPAEARDDAAAVGDHGADYKPVAMAVDYHPAKGWCGAWRCRQRQERDLRDGS